MLLLARRSIRDAGNLEGWSLAETVSAKLDQKQVGLLVKRLRAEAGLVGR